MKYDDKEFLDNVMKNVMQIIECALSNNLSGILEDVTIQDKIFGGGVPVQMNMTFNIESDGNLFFEIDKIAWSKTIRRIDKTPYYFHFGGRQLELQFDETPNDETPSHDASDDVSEDVSDDVSEDVSEDVIDNLRKLHIDIKKIKMDLKNDKQQEEEVKKILEWCKGYSGDDINSQFSCNVDGAHRVYREKMRRICDLGIVRISKFLGIKIYVPSKIRSPWKYEAEKFCDVCIEGCWTTQGYLPYRFILEPVLMYEIDSVDDNKAILDKRSLDLVKKLGITLLEDVYWHAEPLEHFINQIYYLNLTEGIK